MTPSSSFKRISKNYSYTRILNSLIPRSQSDSSQNSLMTLADKRPRRSSDWSETMSILPGNDKDEETHVILRPLQLNNSINDQTSGNMQQKQCSLLQRRLSRGIVTSKSSSNFASEASSKEMTRSHSMKSTRRSIHDHKGRHRGSSIPSEVGSTCSGVKVQQRTISNRSLPLPGDESDYTRLRNFSATSKGVINRGDSFRSRSSTHVPLLVRSPKEKSFSDMNPGLCNVAFTDPTVCKTSVHKVLMIGVQDVGKTSLKNQFMTSEYICDYDSGHEDDVDKVVTVILNSEESQLEFEEETLLDDMNYQRLMCGNLPDAFIVMYSVTSRRSYLRARQLLYQIAPHVEDQKTVVILVANKTDLARLRVVTTDEGRNLAKERSCKFIETSVAINHQVDELLVGILTQIRMKSKLADKKSKRRDSNSRKSMYSGNKASGVLKKILLRACLKSRSCDNLQVL